MSHRESQSKIERNFDTEFSSGDSNKMTQKPKQRYTEENNNEIDELTKDFTEMGCIVDAVKRPNVCVETCVYESDSNSENETEKGDVNAEDTYSDAFEDISDDEKCDKERDSMETENGLRAVQSEENGMRSLGSVSPGQSNLKLSKSQSSVSSKNLSRAGTTSSSKFGSVSVPQTQRINMSFTNSRLREIERHNHILLDKILSARNSRKCSIPPRQPEPALQPRPAPAAMQRKKLQRQIDHDNMILLRKIQQAKSSSCSVRR